MNSSNYVVVHIKLTEGANDGAAAWRGQYSGHVSLEIFYNGGRHIVSYSPANGYAKDVGIFDQDDPNDFSHVRIVLYDLDFEVIIRRFQLLDGAAKRSQLKWHAIARLGSETEGASIYNCASISWHLLCIGGIQKYDPAMKGPDSPALRKKYCCDEKAIRSGFFDGFFWRKWAATPALILHYAASAKEQELRRHPQTGRWEQALSIHQDYTGEADILSGQIDDESSVAENPSSFYHSPGATGAPPQSQNPEPTEQGKCTIS